MKTQDEAKDEISEILPQPVQLTRSNAQTLFSTTATVI